MSWANSAQHAACIALGHRLLEALEAAPASLKSQGEVDKRARDADVGRLMLTSIFAALNAGGGEDRINRLDLVHGVGMAIGGAIAQQTEEVQEVIATALSAGIHHGFTAAADAMQPQGSA